MRTVFPALVAVIVSAACGGGSNPGAPDSGGDAAGDAGQDSGPDAGVDAPMEASTDANEEADGPGCSNSWYRLEDGLQGGGVSDAEFDPRTPGLAYAAGGSRVFSSTDSGDTWKQIGETPYSIIQMGFPANEPGTILAASSSGLLQSMDGGASWSVRSLGGEQLTALYVSASPQTLYAGTSYSGIMRSDDGGNTWTGVNNGLPYGWILDLAGDTANADTLIAGVSDLSNGGFTGYGEIARTTDGGKTWSVGPNTHMPWGLASCPGNGSVVYAALRATGLAQSTDGGRTFPNTLLPSLDVAFVTLDSTCQTVYASVYTQGGVYRSTDGGMTWAGPLENGMMLKPPTYAHPLSISPKDSTRVLASSQAGLFVTKDGGNSWALAKGIETVSSGSVSVSAMESGRLWMATGPSGVWVRPQLGMPWQNVAGVTNANAFTVVADGSQAGRVFVGAIPGLYETTDDGKTWNDVYAPENTFAIAPDPTTPSVIYIGSEVNGVFKTTDGGKTWNVTNGSIPAWPTEVGTFRWISSALVDPSASSHVLVGTHEHGIYKSTDGAISWTAVAPDSATAKVNCLLYAAGNPATIYACAEPIGVLKSTDGGDTWMTLTSGLTSLALTGLTIDSTSGDLFAVTRSEGVFRSHDQGGTWVPLDFDCMPTRLAGSGVAVVASGGSRTLVVAGDGGVLAHPL